MPQGQMLITEITLLVLHDINSQMSEFTRESIGIHGGIHPCSSNQQCFAIAFVCNEPGFAETSNFGCNVVKVT